MIFKRPMFLCLCIAVMQLLQEISCQHPIDPEVRAHLEEKVMSSMSLKELEEMVEQDERVANAPKDKFIIIPKRQAGEEEFSLEDIARKAYIIHRKNKKSHQKAIAEKPEYRFAKEEHYDSLQRSSFEPNYRYESAFKYDEEFPSLFRVTDLESAASSPVKNFYESLVQSVVGERKYGLAEDPMALLEFAASEDVPYYQPRFDYESHARDSTETKLKGKPYWRDAPERREEKVDENGCRTVVKKIMDPEDEKKSSSSNAKSVIITKECEYPSIDGPDAKIPQIEPKVGVGSSILDSDSAASYESESPSYPRPVELEAEKPKGRDPLAPDYIDKMLEMHFKRVPGFSNPITSFKGYQDRFNLRTPSAFKDIKPTVGVHSYEYTHPQSGYGENGRTTDSGSQSNPEAPKKYEHHYHYDYPENAPRDAESGGSNTKDEPIKVHEHNYRYDYPEDSPRKAETADQEGVKESKYVGKPQSPKDPKMMKKSFAYYRKDNPKTDPNDQHYAEEYAQGNYRSFSSDYDSERDGPKKP